jgi:hypothetical protein
MRNATRPTNAITLWTRVLAALLLVAVFAPGLLVVHSLLTERQPPPLPWYETAFLIAFGIPFISVVASVAILGRQPSFWVRLVHRSGYRAQRPAAAFPGWRFPTWLRRPGLLVLGGVTSLYAILITASAIGDDRIRSQIPLLVLVWTLAIGVVIALIRWWRVP